MAGQTFADSGSASCVSPPSSNDPPVANDDNTSTPKDTPVSIDVAANDTDPDGTLDPASVNIACPTCAAPTNGSMLNNGDGTFDYTPNSGFTGSDSFVYEVCDTIGACDDEVSTEATSLTIQGEDVDNAATFTTVNGSVSSRPTTTAAVSWSPPSWITKDEAGPDQQTPNIASVVQEIVSRPGWASGNSLVIFITGTGKRTAESYNGVPIVAPLLHVEF